MAAKQYFRPWLLRHMKDESENHDQCIALSIYVGLNPIARIECVGHLHEKAYELTFLYTYRNYCRLGIARYLLELAEKEMKYWGAEMVYVTPIRMSGENLPDITDDELVDIYEHLGFHKANFRMEKYMNI
ncbi:GNAT family N-acetyltransferase [Blautia sp.]|jgi:GNAT superfamily N-acetyltransferase|uniref:GNAT family N-acetyltransferase n=1 Tax=Blautia sp. TaxID=1955243 RepID=UPI003A48C3B6